MKNFLSEDFFLTNDRARRLYHEFAAPQPILDYHCHLPPRDIAENRRFANLFEIWLEGDHYKWRAMRANGVDEKYCTGDAEPYKKFLAWARTVPYTLRNPLYVWTHLELQRYFGISELLDESSAPAIWERANADLAGDLTAQAILKKFHVPLTILPTTCAIIRRWQKRIRLPEFSPHFAPTKRYPWAKMIFSPGSTACRRQQMST
jgi:glucuronate isomerase